MMKRLWGLAALCLLPAVAAAREDDPRAVLTTPIAIERNAPVTELPFDWRMEKIHVEATANGVDGEFIFDTGSPSIISRDLADRLGVQTLARNTGRDANGSNVTMEIGLLDRLELGDIAFGPVPVMIFDFSTLPSGACFIGDGVIGSEIMPGSAWRIDLEARTLTIAESVDRLPPVEAAISARLHDFGYPHAPIIDYSLGDIEDRALFDTGSAARIALFGGLMENDSVRARIDMDTVSRGEGTEGESAGGRGAPGPLARFTLEEFQVDGQDIAPIRADLRRAPPTLVGAGMLATHLVTLDYPGGRLHLTPRDAPEPARPEAGYAIAWTGDGAEVVQLFENSPAAQAGLRLGDRVTAIDDRALTAGDDERNCDHARWLAQTFDAAQGGMLTVMRGGVSVAVSVDAAD